MRVSRAPLPVVPADGDDAVHDGDAHLLRGAERHGVRDGVHGSGHGGWTRQQHQQHQQHQRPANSRQVPRSG